MNKLLESKNSRVSIHVDAKTDNLSYNKIRSAFGERENLKIIEEHNRVNVKWGKYSQIEAMLLLLKNAKKYNFRYFSLISGDDIPLSNNFERETCLNKAYEQQIEFSGCNPTHNAYERLSVRYPEFLYKKDHSITAKIVRKFYIMYAKKFRKNDISNLPTLYKGSSWFTLSDQAVDFIFSFLKNNPHYEKAFRNSLCGDEVFFQTILFNSPFKEKIYGLKQGLKDCEMGMRYIDWESGPDFPRVFDVGDYVKMKNSGLLFARKLPSDISLSELERNFG